MYLEILNINSFIKNNNILEVKNAKFPSQKGFDEDGLWSETIFGKLGSRNRKQQFGYVDLKSNFIHPIAYEILRYISEPISKILKNKDKFIIRDKKLIKDNSGGSGLSFLIDNFLNIDFRISADSNKIKEAEYIENNKNIILINKFLITPAGDRDIDISNISKTSEINELYRSLIFQILSLSGVSDIDNLIKSNIQNQLIKIVKFIRDKYLKGKKGLIRGNMMKKSTDYSSRLVLTSSPNIPLGYVSIPWHTALTIFEPLVSYNLFKKDNDILDDIKKEIHEDDHFDSYDLIKFLDTLVKNPENINPNLKIKLFNLITEITKDQVILCKRDPVVQRNLYFSANILINDGRVAILNSLDLAPIGGDCDGDTVAIMPLFTKEAKEEAIKNMHISTTKSKMIDSKSLSNTLFVPNLDAMSAIYTATKNYDQKNI